MIRRYTVFITMILSVLSVTALAGCTAYDPKGYGPDHRFYPQSEQTKAYQAAFNYRFPNTREATGRNVFIFDPKHKVYALYNNAGYLIRQGRASGGKNYCADIKSACRTPPGTYKVYYKKGKACKSSKYPIGKGGAPMPYCMFFKGGYAIHGSTHVPDYNASHGCVRVTPADAAWLSKYHLQKGDTVIIKPYE